MILVISSKKVYAAKRLAVEAGRQKLEVRIMDVRDLVLRRFKVDLKKFGVLYIRDPFFEGTPKYTPQIIKLAKQFKRLGKRVVDSVIADGELGRGKWEDYKKLIKAGISVPKTTSLNHGRDLNKYGHPFILKWVYGFKAQNVFLINNQAELKTILPLHLKKEWLVQEFVKAEYEYKVITVGYKALPVILRFKILDSGFRTDFDKYEVIKTPTTPSASRPPLLKGGGGASAFAKASADKPRLSLDMPRGISSFSKEEYPPQAGEAVGADKIKKIIQLAEQSSSVLKRELAKVDILEAQGKFYILEVNRFPGLKSFEEFTKYNAIKEFLGYLQKPQN